MKIANLLTILLTGLSISAQAPRVPKTLQYLTAAETDPARLLPPPAQDGSAEQKLEMANLKRLLEARTPERFAQAQWDNKHENTMAFAPAIGHGFDLKNLPETAKLMAAVENDLSVAVSAAKTFFNRKSAIVLDPTLIEFNCEVESARAAAAKPGMRPGRSYPSGHVTLAYTVAVFIGSLIPTKSQALLARAEDYAYSREVCGDHYHADVEAGHALGNTLAILFLNNAALQPQIEAAKAELRAAHISE